MQLSVRTVGFVAIVALILVQVQAKAAKGEKKPVVAKKAEIVEKQVPIVEKKVEAEEEALDGDDDELDMDDEDDKLPHFLRQAVDDEDYADYESEEKGEDVKLNTAERVGVESEEFYYDDEDDSDDATGEEGGAKDL